MCEVRNRWGRAVPKPARCRKCGVELSFRELMANGVHNVDGGLMDNGGMCAICAGDRREEAYGDRSVNAR